ncbi:MAG TPA: S53 family peptidase [Candidatus Cybelea sp.]|jgi:subtilase family serine protease
MSLQTRCAAAIAAAMLTACSRSTALPPGAGGATAFQVPVGSAGAAAGRQGGLRFSVALPLRDQQKLTQLLEGLQDPSSPTFRKFISRRDFLRSFAPKPEVLAAVARELAGAGFTVSVGDQAVTAAGTQTQAERYFRTPLQMVGSGSSEALAPRTRLTLSPLLESSEATIVGLNGIPPMRVFSKLARPNGGLRPDNIEGPYGPYFGTDLKQAYQYPSYLDATGAGVTIGIVIDSPVSQSDIEEYFRAEDSKVAPSLKDVKIDGGGKYGGDGTGEATLDVQQSGGMAPRANIVIFDTPSLSDSDIYDAYSAVVKDKSIVVVNSSFGGCELAFKTVNGLKELKAYDAIFKQGLSEGITWVAASGDHAAMQCGSNNKKGVVWPAVSPYVLAVGGTNLTTSYAKGSPNSKYQHEDAYADIKPNNGGDYWGSGGGYSVIYPRPAYQKAAVAKPARGLPDVSVHMGGEGFSSGGHSCEAQKCNLDDSSDTEYVEGQWTESIGTSAASPDFVGLLALTAELVKGKLGPVNAELYTAANKRKGYYFRKGLKGNNGYPTTAALWDPVLGLGTPYGARVAGAKSVAGEPTSPSNP